jgi:uncharacterized protein DUF4349
MSTLAESLGTMKKPWQWIAIGGGILLIWGAVAFPRFNTYKMLVQPMAENYAPAPIGSNPTLLYEDKPADALKVAGAVPPQSTETAVGRKIIRTTSMSVVVEHPADVAEKITALAESLGGYLVAADGGGQDATYGTLTIRVPAERFEQARAEIRKLGVRVESEKVEAQDVTRQYVDQDANIRNLRAEEAGYLAILKQANTVKDMLAVSQQLSNVRGQIEQQQAEFNALSRQIETVAIAISLRKESEAQVFGLNWRPMYQLKLALRDGLESVANYATAMTTILFYLPAALLWVGTIFGAIVIGSKLVRWIGRHWFGWKAAETTGA